MGISIHFAPSLEVSLTPTSGYQKYHLHIIKYTDQQDANKNNVNNKNWGTTNQSINQKKTAKTQQINQSNKTKHLH